MPSSSAATIGTVACDRPPLTLTFAANRTHGPNLLKSLERKDVRALFALSSDFLKGDDSKTTVKELVANKHLVGYFYRAVKDQPLSSLSDDRVRSHLQMVKERFEKHHGMKLEYIVFQYPEFEENRKRLAAIAEQEGLTVVVHNLYLAPETAAAKATIESNVFQAGLDSHIALMEGYGTTSVLNVEELAMHAKRNGFHIVSFAACDADKKVAKDSESFELQSLECRGRVRERGAEHKDPRPRSRSRPHSTPHSRPRTYVNNANVRGAKESAPVNEGKNPTKGKKTTFVRTEDMRSAGNNKATMMKALVAKDPAVKPQPAPAAKVDVAKKDDAAKKDDVKGKDATKAAAAPADKNNSNGNKAEDKKDCKDGDGCQDAAKLKGKNEGVGAVSLTTTSFALALALISAAVALF